MAEFYGWVGTILNIDLTEGKIEKEPLSPTFARKYLGASGFNSAKLFELVKPEVDALSSENVLMFGVGTLTGTLALGSARLTVTAKSPLTDIFGDSSMGGHWSTELKFAGYDQLVFFGKADHPVYLWIDDGKVELRDASHLWGKSTWDTARVIKEEIGDPFIQVVCIGPAGENLVRFANIICPTKHAAGRAGMGAVMGSKNLKGIAVRGLMGVATARPDEFLQTCMEMRQMVGSTYPYYAIMHEFGSPALLEFYTLAGVSGVRNFQRNLFPSYRAISGKRFKRDFIVQMMACPSCLTACHLFHSVRSGEFAGIYGGGPEFGLTQLGLRCDIDNAPALLKINELSNQYGVDCVSAAAVISWAMDCYEKGILTKEDFDGTPLSFGDYKAVVDIIPKIARREGFGTILAEGEKRAPKLVGRGSEKYMYHVKGQAPVIEDPRANKFFGFQYYTGTRGADHLKGNSPYIRYLLRDTDIGKEIKLGSLDVRSPKGVGNTLKWCEDVTQVIDSLGVCTRAGGSIQLLTRALSSATGVDFSEKELLGIGERIYNIQKAFNSRQGLTRKDDNFSVPEKFTEEPIKDGPCKGSVVERDLMLDDYYKTREWDLETGLQTRKKLVELGLEHIADELQRVNAVK